MSFANIVKSEYSGDSFSKVHYTRIKEGQPVRLRILDKEALHVTKHYMPHARASVVCHGFEACPICQNNKKLIEANPDTRPNQIKGYFSRQNRYLVNVLNRTPAKITENGTPVFATNGVYPASYSETGENLTAIEPTPVNRVEVLERGVTLFSQLNTINETLTDEAGNPLGLWTYDIIVSASGSGTDMVTTVTPNVAANDVVDIAELGLELNDLEDVSLNLNPEEVQKLMQGVSLKDIFASQQVVEAVENGQAGLEEATEQDIDKTIQELFPD